MLLIPKEKILERWDDLSTPIREVLTSDITAQFIQDTCRAEFIPVEKVPLVAGAVTDVLMGFLHPTDLSGEIQKSIGVDARIAGPLATAINQRIFIPIQAEIDHAYKPLSAVSTPKIVQEIRPVESASIPVGSAPKMINTVVATVPQMPPATNRPNNPISMDIQASPRIVPATAGISGTAIPKPVIAPTPTVTTTAVGPAPKPKPLIFQTDSTSHPIQHAPDFKVLETSRNIMDSRSIPKPLPIRPAVVEFTGAPIKKEFVSPMVNAVMQKMPIPNGDPPRPNAARIVTEVTSETLRNITTPAPTSRPSVFTPISQIPVPSAPKPGIPQPTPVSMPPKSPIIPATPTPRIAATPMPKPTPAAPTEKVVQKDYSEGK